MRVFEVDAYLRRGLRIEITTDASPYGLGAVLTVDKEIVSHLASPLTTTDREVLGLPSVPSSSDQQAAEALAILVSLREWAPRWQNRRANLCLRTDNIAALTTLVKLQPHSSTLGIIARELALDIAASSFTPDEVVHIPGIANVSADCLSRQYESTPQPLPDHFLPSLRASVPLRLRLWWSCLSSHVWFLLWSLLLSSPLGVSAGTRSFRCTVAPKGTSTSRNAQRRR